MKVVTVDFPEEWRERIRGGRPLTKSARALYCGAGWIERNGCDGAIDRAPFVPLIAAIGIPAGSASAAAKKNSRRRRERSHVQSAATSITQTCGEFYWRFPRERGVSPHRRRARTPRARPAQPLPAPRVR